MFTAACWGQSESANTGCGLQSFEGEKEYQSWQL